MIVATTVADFSRELIEVAPLDGLQAVGDAVQRRISRGIVPDAGGRTLGVGPVALEASAVALTPESGEPDADFLPRATTHKADRGSFQADA